MATLIAIRLSLAQTTTDDVNDGDRERHQSNHENNEPTPLLHEGDTAAVTLALQGPF